MLFEKRNLRKEIGCTLFKDRHLLKRRFNSLPSVDDKKFDKSFQSFKQLLDKSLSLVENRKASLPNLAYPAELPITAKKDEICQTIREHQVVVITGETGSGKTTQIPKMCLEAGRGIFGKIACTQPRRIAATSLSSQVAKELGTTVGDTVGFRIRFADKSSETTLIQFVTDGLLLAEIQRDRFLSEYDTIIIDEAHERTLNIDFLLGYLKQLLPKRPELKLIITSATIDIDKFSAAFPQMLDKSEKLYRTVSETDSDSDSEIINAPIISVSGRMYPVEVRYFPLDEVMEDQGDQTMIDLVQMAVEDLLTERGFGDILVFLSGEQEIRETHDRLTFLQKEGFEVLPLYGRLTAAEQNRIFKHDSNRKIILSTNIAETSITVPGIHYVVDTGRARFSQFNTRTGTQGLPIKAISQSSADQRKGRCGRVADGICVRLYSEEDYLKRDQYTTPEIQRSNLSEVILRMLSLRLGDVSTFPFIDPPESAQIRAGYRTLRELGALNGKKNLTPIGREMASLPLDPRTARMVLQAKYEKTVYPVLIIASAISCQDPKEKPEDKKTQANQKHARFKSKESDLMSLLNLWEEYHSTMDELKTQGKMRKFCKANFLSYNKIREWRDIHTQLTAICNEKKWEIKKPDNFDYDGIHRSILAGYLPHIAKLKEKKTYQGTRNRELVLFPGSDQYQSRHQWIVAIELIETKRLFAHTIAKIDPAWLESLAGNQCKKSWSQPFWDPKTQRVLANEKVTLFGFCLVEDRKVFYGRINREESNLIFIREALIEGNFDSDLPFWKNNRKLIKEIEIEEAKLRSRNLLVTDDVIENFYLKRLTGIACLDDLKKVIKKNGGDRFLFMNRDDLLRRDLSDTSTMFPPFLKIGEYNCKLHYVFEPGHQNDGVTIHIPYKLLGSIRPEDFEYLVPGLLKEKILWLLKNLPKEIRRKLVPIPDKAEKIWEEMISFRFSTNDSNSSPVLTGDFYKELTETTFKVTREHISPELWKKDDMPDYLKMNYALKKPRSNNIEFSRDLQQFSYIKKKPVDEWNKLIQRFERWDIKTWDFGRLMEETSIANQGDIDIWGYKALVLKENNLNLTIIKSQEEALEACIRAVPKLIEIQLGDELAWLFNELRFPPETLFRFRYLWESKKELTGNRLRKKFDSLKSQAQREFHEIVQNRTYRMVYEGLCGFDGDPILTESRFVKKIDTIKSNLKGLGSQVIRWVSESLEMYHQVLVAIQQQQLMLTRNFRERIYQELEFFFSVSCLEDIPLEQWKHCTRILKCYQKRIERHLENPQDEESRYQKLMLYQQKAIEFKTGTNKNTSQRWLITRFCWMLEELKVSEFAQGLTTAFPISPKRIDKFLSQHF